MHSSLHEERAQGEGVVLEVGRVKQQNRIPVPAVLLTVVFNNIILYPKHEHMEQLWRCSTGIAVVQILCSFT